MRKVKMLVDTAYKGPVKAGEEINVPDDFANRWVKNKIAVLVEEEKEEVVEGTTDADDVAEIDYSSMKVKELYDLCVERGIEVEVKQPKQYYIDKLA